MRRPYLSKWVQIGLGKLADPGLFPLPTDTDEARAIKAARRYITKMNAWRAQQRKEARNARRTRQV